MIVAILIISFLLDGIMFSLANQALPLFSLMSLILTYAYHQDNSKMYWCAIILGMFYDIVYTNSLFLNTLLFTGIIYLVNKIFRLITNNFLNTFWVTFLTIILYRTTIYGFYCILDLAVWSFKDLSNCILMSIIINGIYLVIAYILIKWCAKKLRIKRKI